MMSVRFLRILLSTALVICAASAVLGQGEEPEPDPEAQFLDQLATNGIPAAYGEILSALSDSAGDALKEAVKSKSGEIVKFANQKVWRDKISALNQAIGRALAVLDVSGKIYSEDYYEATISAGLTFISELAGSESGKALLQSYGITGPIVATALTSFTIWRESAKALSEATMGREMESLYGTIENMTRSRGRTLGEGDPFPVTPENVEKVWKRIVSDPAFRRLFQAYVEGELQKEFPGPGFWDKVDVYIADPIISAAAGGGTPADGFAAAAADPNTPSRESTAAERLEKVQQQKLMAQHAEMKQYVAGLIGWLNRAAKVQEQQVIARQAFAQMKAKIEAGGMTMDQYFAKIQKALDMGGVVEAYLKNCMPAIEKAAKEEDYETLQAHLRMSRDYVRDVVAWLPATGPTAEYRKQLFEGLKASYKAAADGIRAIKKRLAQKVEKPSPPPPAQGQQVPAQSVDPLNYYVQYFKPLIKPFDWGGNTDPQRALKGLRDAIAAGEFKPPDNLYALPASKKPRADAILEGWQKQNWAVAFGGGAGATLPVPDGSAEQSIAAYERKLKADIAAQAGKTPDDLAALRQSLKAQGEAIEARYREGEAMVFPSKYGKKPPEGETPEQVRARIEAGQAIMQEAGRMSAALQPEREREAAIVAAWAAAGKMAEDAASAEVAAAKLAHAEVGSAMSSELSLAQMKARGVASQMNVILGRLKSIPLPPPGSPSAEDLVPALGQARRTIDGEPYTKLGAMNKPPDSTVGAGLAAAAGQIAGGLRERAMIIRNDAARAEAEALALAEAYERGEKEFDALLSEFAEDLQDIRELVDPAFLAQDDWVKRRDASQAAARSLRAEAQALTARADQEASNREVDAFWLQRAAVNFQRLVSVGQSYGVVEEAGSYGAGGSLRVPLMDDRGIAASVPYPHYVTQAEKNEALTDMRAIWTSTNLSKFAETIAPWLKDLVEGYFQQLAQAPGFPEENFFVSSRDGGRAGLPVTKSGLARAQELMAKMQPGTPAFEEGWRALFSIVPLEVSYGGSSAAFRDVVVPSQSPLSAPYVAFRNKLKELYAQHLQLADTMREEERKKQADEARRILPGLIAAIRQRLQDAQKLVDAAMEAQTGDRAAIEQLYRRLEDFHTNILTSEPYPRMTQAYGALGSAEDPLFKDAESAANQVGVMSGRLHEARSRLQDLLNKPEDRSAELREFYNRFKQAYESRSEARLMGLIADSWSAGDGTTVDDLRDHFRNMFTVFNEIRVAVSNVQGQKVGTDRWQVTYDITITGRIFDNNIKHEEKSSVTEEVQLDPRGGKIVKTLQGRFWYVQ
ncbi:MAG: hypothetical protein KatS3mg024_2238 [Armatimonadota bacterium]|nr:MAG: hypothetical protein KatS3mg024_2238 [Armatimonadota bacterium]